MPRSARARSGSPRRRASRRVGLVVVVDDPVVAEADDQANDRPGDRPEARRCPAVVAGRIGKLEDVDWYAFEADKGERVSSRSGATASRTRSTTCRRTSTRSCPPRRPGREAGRRRQHALRRPAACPSGSRRAGTYYLQIRDTTYSGNPSWSYATPRDVGAGCDLGLPDGGQPGQRRTPRGPRARFRSRADDRARRAQDSASGRALVLAWPGRRRLAAGASGRDELPGRRRV